MRLLAAHLGIPLELREIDVIDRSSPREQLAGLNPTRNTPTLVLDDGRPLAESNAIIWYLGDGSQYAPTDPYERAQVLQWQFFEQYQVEPSLAVVRFLIAFSGKAEQHAARIEEQTANGYIALDAIE
ncbi:MAG: glutathione S-transferase family protein, partial [Actinomycetota bacterium]